jgi:hypothetical protein
MFLTTMVLLALYSLLVLAAAGSTVVAPASEMLAKARKKVFLDKCGMQLADLGSLLGLCILLGSATGTGVLLYTTPLFRQAYAWPPALAGAAAAALAVLLLLVYRFTWKPLKKRKGVHVPLGLLSLVASLAALMLVLAVKRQFLLQGMPAPDAAASVADSLRDLLAISPTSAFWILLAQALLLLPTATGALGLVYLLLRRNRDDFGRDYYNFALPYSAKWALFPGLAQFGVMLWLGYDLMPRLGEAVLSNANVTAWLIGCALALLACLPWLVLARSRTCCC